MKKVLSLVLAFAMILGSFGFVFASDFPDVSDTEYFSEPVNVLSGFGVIGGFPDGTFGPEKEVTRAQMATMIVNALGMTVNGQSDTKFSDVPKSHWASGFIAYATSVGFVAGYPDGTFKPDDPVTYDQALTMIVAAEGYKAESLPGNWPGNFVNKAKSLGMLDICATTGTDKAPRGDIACFLYKALTNKIGYTDKDGEFHANLDAKGNATDTMIARLGGTPYLPDAQGNPTPFVVDGTQSSDISLDDYFGAYITAYASKNDNTKIIAVAEVLSEFIEGKVTANKSIGDYKVTSATKQLTPGFVYFENGEISTAKTKYDATTGKPMIFAVKLDGAKVAEVYSAQEWTAAGTFRAADTIQEELADDQTLDSGTYSFVLDDDDAIDESEFIMVGKNKLADLAEDDIITVYLDKITTGDVAKLEVSTNKVEGEITQVTKKGELVIAGTTYALATGSPAATMTPALTVEDEGTFFLDYAGDIFDFEATKDTTKNYAVVLKTGQDASRYAGGETPYIQLFTADGNAVDFEAAAKITFNGGATPTTITYTPGTNVWATPAVPAGSVVEYEVDSDNVLVGLTVKTDVNEPLKTAAPWYKFTGMVYSGKKATASTVVFSYTGPAAMAPADLADKANYAVIEASELEGAEFSYMVGGIDSGSYTAVLVAGVSASSKSLAIIVDDSAGKNADGNIYTALYEGAINEKLVAKQNLSSGVYTTGAAATVYTFVFEGDVVKTATPATLGMDYLEQKFAPTAKLKAADITYFMDAADTNYPLDAEAVTYIYDAANDKWSKAGKLALVKYQYITLIDSDKDGDWDIVIATK